MSVNFNIQPNDWKLSTDTNYQQALTDVQKGDSLAAATLAANSIYGNPKIPLEAKSALHTLIQNSLSGPSSSNPIVGMAKYVDNMSYEANLYNE